MIQLRHNKFFDGLHLYYCYATPYLLWTPATNEARVNYTVTVEKSLHFGLSKIAGYQSVATNGYTDYLTQETFVS